VVDLARQMIRLAGLREGEDVDIEYIGLRPGEKLHEELHTREEEVRITRRERILTWQLPAEDEATLRTEVAELERVAADGDAGAIRRALGALVPEYRAPSAGGNSVRGSTMR
jgi:FlaA1/EpsC-like NDP-sugar epimerase